MIRYMLQEGLADNLVLGMRPVPVTTEAGAEIGRVVRGELEGCERRATFRFEPVEGDATTLGVHVAGILGKLARLVAPRYRVVQGERTGELRDSPGENLLYFAVRGELDGRTLVARSDWDDTIEVTYDGRKIARLAPGAALAATEVRIVADLVPADLAFQAVVLLVFIARLYADESDVVEQALDF